MPNLNPIWLDYRKQLPNAYFYTVDKYGQQMLHDSAIRFNHMSGTWYSTGKSMSLGLKPVASQVELDPITRLPKAVEVDPRTGIPVSSSSEFSPFNETKVAEDTPKAMIDETSQNVTLPVRSEPVLINPVTPAAPSEQFIGVKEVVKPQEFTVTEVIDGKVAKTVPMAKFEPVNPHEEVVTVTRKQLTELYDQLNKSLGIIKLLTK